MEYYVLKLNPEPWAIGPLSVGRGQGKLYPQVGRNMQLHAYKEAVKGELEQQIRGLLEDNQIEGKVKLHLFFWRRRDAYTTPQARVHRKHEADLTNLQKATEDALQGIFFKNDKDVVEVHSYLVAQDEDIEPRVVIGIEPADPLDPSVLPQYVWDQIDETPDLLSDS